VDVGEREAGSGASACEHGEKAKKNLLLPTEEDCEGRLVVPASPCCQDSEDRAKQRIVDFSIALKG